MASQVTGNRIELAVVIVAQDGQENNDSYWGFFLVVQNIIAS